MGLSGAQQEPTPAIRYDLGGTFTGPVQVGQGNTQIINPPTPPPALAPGAAQPPVMIARVRATWIDGLLKQSLYGATLIELGLQTAAGRGSQPLALCPRTTGPARPRPCRRAP